jgi:uracil phosphoribosyltransferase
MITNFSANSSVVSEWMRELRDTSIQGDRARFRTNLERLGGVAAYEISKTLPYEAMVVSTPLGTKMCMTLSQQPVIATILRAGLPLYHGLLHFFPHADSAFIGSYRKHVADSEHFNIHQQYITCPDLKDRVLILADPMVATGSSVVTALDVLREFEKPAAIHLVAAISCSVGLDLIKRKYPEVQIWTGDIDDEITAKGYIVPGLGDAGDLSFGTKMQA